MTALVGKMAGQCGSCTGCCRVYPIPALEKRAGKWCQHCEIGVGCKIYESRPPQCVDFACYWLQGHQRGQGMPEAMRPDRCKVVFTPTNKEGLMSGITMPGSPDAWRKGAAREIIDKIIGAGFRVVVGPPASTTKVMIDRYGEREVQMTEPDENGIQWSIGEDHYE